MHVQSTVRYPYTRSFARTYNYTLFLGSCSTQGRITCILQNRPQDNLPQFAPRHYCMCKHLLRNEFGLRKGFFSEKTNVRTLTDALGFGRIHAPSGVTRFALRSTVNWAIGASLCYSVAACARVPCEKIMRTVKDNCVCCNSPKN